VREADAASRSVAFQSAYLRATRSRPRLVQELGHVVGHRLALEDEGRVHAFNADEALLGEQVGIKPEQADAYKDRHHAAPATGGQHENPGDDRDRAE
jgi:hypothetical protein